MLNSMTLATVVGAVVTVFVAVYAIKGKF